MSKFRDKKKSGEKIDMLGGEGSGDRSITTERLTMADLTMSMLGGSIPAVERANYDNQQQEREIVEVVPNNVIVIEQDGSLTYAGYGLTTVGLIDNPNATFDDWQNIGGMLFGLEGSIQWLIGDWLIVGSGKWGNMYTEAITQFGREYGTLANYKSLCERFEFSRRRENLTFGHHDAVKALVDDIQDQFLDYAEAQKLSVSKLRKAVKEWGVTEDPDTDHSFADAVTMKAVQDTSVFLKSTTAIQRDPQKAIDRAKASIEVLEKLIQYAGRFVKS